MLVLFIFFFFSSRRRHTRFDCDWSSDVCSSDLDRQGPPEYNKVLAQRRAEAVKQFLVDLGAPEASVKIVTIGQDGALCDDPSNECQQLNRRVHVEIRKLAH